MNAEAARPFWWLAGGFGLFAAILIAAGLTSNAGGAVGACAMMLMAGIITRLT